MKVFVTGSTGLLGNNLVRQLLAAGHEVTGLTRRAEKFERMLGDTAATAVVGDMTDVQGFADAMAGADAVVHTAAYFREYYQSGDHVARLEEINVQGTLSLMAAADEHGVEAFVHISSAGTIGRRPDGAPGDENTPAGPEQLKNLYFQSKVAGDAKIRAHRPSHGMRVVQILPGWMWGPGDAGPTGAGQIVLDFVDGKFPAVPFGGTSLVDARDVAAATIEAISKPHGARYIVGGTYYTLRQIIDHLALETGRPAPKANLPAWVALTYAHLSEAWARVTGGRAAANVAGVRTMAQEHAVDSAKALRELNASFRPLEQTISDVVDWYVRAEMLPSELSFRRRAHRTTASMLEA